MSFTFLTILPLLVFSLTESVTKVTVSKRDPFYVPKTVQSRNIRNSIEKPKVLGIISASNKNSDKRKKGAIVSFGKKTEIINVGDKINGFTILEIKKDGVLVKTSSKEEKKWVF